MPYTYLDDNTERVRRDLTAAARRGGHDPDAVTLMAAVKSGDIDEINYLHTVLGVHSIGENRVQQLLERYDRLEKAGLSIHFIGTLQTNKVKYIIDKVDMIQSLDSDRLADEIERQAAKHALSMDVLIEINSGEEAAKSGVSPAEAEAFARRITGEKYPHLCLCGFMTMAPRSTEDEYHAYFSATRTLAEGIWSRLVAEGLVEPARRMVLSMGMSESYIPAAEEGATLVRVGRGLFARPSETVQEP